MIETFGINQAAYLTNVTRQAVYVAIKSGRLNATKEKQWRITSEALEEYRNNRWDRMKSKVDGKPLVCPEKGEYLVRQIADTLGVTTQKIYYAIRSEKMKAQRRGTAYVVRLDDAMAYKQRYLEAVA